MPESQRTCVADTDVHSGASLLSLGVAQGLLSLLVLLVNLKGLPSLLLKANMDSVGVRE